MEEKELLKKLRPGHRCRYIGKDEEGFGFVYGAIYHIVERLPFTVAFNTKKNIGAIDFSLQYGGDDFFESWQIVDKELVNKERDIDWDKEEFQYSYQSSRLNQLIDTN